MRTAAARYRSDIWSSELRLALSPEKMFAHLVANTSAAPARSLLARLLLILVTIAMVVPLMAVQRVTASLVLTAAVTWSSVLAIQIVVATAVISSSSRRRVSVLHALDLWFAGHLPYSLWMVAGAAIAANSRLVDPAFLFATGVVPAAWTAWIVAAFCRVVLIVDAAGSRRRAAAHQAVVWAIALTYAAVTSGGWFRLVEAARILR